MYTVAVRWAPAHELVLSLGTYLDKKVTKLTDLGPAWAGKVKKQLDPGFAARLAEEVPIDGAMLHLLVGQHGGQPDAAAFLTWLAALSPGQLYDHVAPSRCEEAPPLPADLGAHRDLMVDLLGRWNEQYFARLDPSVLAGLAAEATARRQSLPTAEPQNAVEAATNGILLDPVPGMEQVWLIPAWHSRPVNRFIRFKGFGLYLYGYDDPPAPGSMPPRLLRVLRALPDESRIRILRYISREPRSFMEIVRHTGLALSTVHHHLVALRAAGLVRVHELSPGPGAPGQNSARYSFRPSALEGLGDRLIEALHGGEPL